MFDTARVVAGAPVTVRFTPYDADGEPGGVDPGTVTVDVIRSDGTVLVTAAATTGTGTDPRTYDLAATHTRLLDHLTVLWEVAGVAVHETTVDVVGGHLAILAEIRGTEPSLADTSVDRDAGLLQARAEVEDMFERACGTPSRSSPASGSPH